MAFAVEDFDDLIRLLHEHPDWRARLSAVLFGDRLDRIEALVEQNTRGLAALQVVVDENTRGLAALQAVVEQNGRQIAELVRVVESLSARIGRIEPLLGDVLGWRTEERVRSNGAGLFGSVLRKPRVVQVTELPEVDEAYASGRLAKSEFDEIGRLDAVLRGRRWEDDADILIAVEASRTVRLDDLDRVERPTLVLRRLGLQVVPVAAGELIDEEDEARARTRGIALLIDGRVLNWPAA